MRIGIFQGPPAAGTAGDMLAALQRVAAEQAALGTRLLVMPELFLSGYNIGAEALRARAESSEGPASAAAASIARTHGIALLYGYAERSAAGPLYNSALLIGADGRALANYRKMHLFGAMENAVFSAGDTAAVLAEIDGTTLGILICYDVEFPELVRTLALRGADLVAVPTALMHPYDFVPEVLVRARAYENQVFLAYANRCGSEADLDYTGLSCIVGPDGSVLARAGADESVISAVLDPQLLAKSRALNTYLADRRPTLYTALTETTA